MACKQRIHSWLSFDPADLLFFGMHAAFSHLALDPADLLSQVLMSRRAAPRLIFSLLVLLFAGSPQCYPVLPGNWVPSFASRAKLRNKLTCSATADRPSLQKTQASTAESVPRENLRAVSLQRVREVVQRIVDNQWEIAFAENNTETTTTSTEFPSKHIVGGFSVVLRLPNNEVAFRLQALDSLKAGLTWVAFYECLWDSMSQTAPESESEVLASACRPDRTLLASPLGGPPSLTAWEDTKIVRQFQSERLLASTRRLGRMRRRVNLCWVSLSGRGWGAPTSPTTSLVVAPVHPTSSPCPRNCPLPTACLGTAPT